MNRALMLKEVPLWLATLALLAWALTMLVKKFLDYLGSDRRALEDLSARLDKVGERLERVVENSERQKELLLRLYERINR